MRSRIESMGGVEKTDQRGNDGKKVEEEEERRPDP